MSYIFKGDSARLIKHITETNLAAKEIYCAELLIMDNQGKVLINFDESSLDKSIW